MIERMAIEALRAGVPNRAAIRELRTGERELEARFVEMLDASEAELEDGRQVRGLILAGGFGSGKSHLLGYMQELALQRGFVVSLVPVSKETPLFDAGKLYEAAVRNAAVPSSDGDIVNDDLMTAVMQRLRRNELEYEALEDWASSAGSGLVPLFAALLHLVPRRQIEPDAIVQIGRFFAGGRIGTPKVRQWLREAGAAGRFDLRMPRMAELAQQRLRFLPRLLRAAGFSGWCVLMDEIELVGRYSPLQRGRAYAEIGRWLGLLQSERLPGVVGVCALTDDFTEAVIVGKCDRERIPRLLEERNVPQAAESARIAIRALESEKKVLRPPDQAVLEESLLRVAGLYREAYGWEPRSIEIGERLAGKSMRQYIKSWITMWDIERLYGERGDVSTEMIGPDYAENTDYERAPSGGEGAGR